MTTSAPRTTEALAAQVEEAIGDGQDLPSIVRFLAAVMTPEILITHTPPMESDGLNGSAEWATVDVENMGRVLKVVPDLRYESAEVTVESESAILLRTVVVGTLPSGDTHSFALDRRITVDKGNITGMHGAYSSAEMAPFNDAVRARLGA